MQAGVVAPLYMHYHVLSLDLYLIILYHELSLNLYPIILYHELINIGHVLSLHISHGYTLQISKYSSIASAMTSRAE